MMIYLTHDSELFSSENEKRCESNVVVIVIFNISEESK